MLPPTSEKLEPHPNLAQDSERSSAQPNYYEKDGLRIRGDGEDYEHEPPVLYSSLPQLKC